MSDKKLDQIEEKIDAITNKLHSIDKSLVKYNTELEYHIVRTDELQQHVSNIDDFMQYMKRHIYMVQGVLAFLGVLATLATIWELIR